MNNGPDYSRLTQQLIENFGWAMNLPVLVIFCACAALLFSIIAFILAPNYSKGKHPGAKSAGTFFSVFGLILGIVALIGFIVFTIAIIIYTDGEIYNTGKLRDYLSGIVFAPVCFGIPVEWLITGAGGTIKAIIMYGVALFIPAIISFIARGVSYSAKKKFKRARAAMTPPVMPQGAPYQPQPAPQMQYVRQPAPQPIPQPAPQQYVQQPAMQPQPMPQQYIQQPAPQPIPQPVPQPQYAPPQPAMQQAAPVQEAPAPRQEITENDAKALLEDTMPVFSAENTQPVPEPAPEPVAEPAPEPVAEPVPEPVAEPAPEPAAEPVSEPVVEPAPEPAAEPVSELVVEPAPASNEKRFCVNCGAELLPEAVFCMKCGTKR